MDEECPGSLLNSARVWSIAKQKNFSTRIEFLVFGEKKNMHINLVIRLRTLCLHICNCFIILPTIIIQRWKELLWRAKGKIFLWYELVAIPCNSNGASLQVSSGGCEWKLLTSFFCVMRTLPLNVQTAIAATSQNHQNCDIGSWCCETWQDRSDGQTGRHGVSNRQTVAPHRRIAWRTSWKT